MSTNAFVYVATGKEYLEEAVESCQRLALVEKNCLIVLATDRNTLAAFDSAVLPFDEILIIEKPKYEFVDKIRVLKDLSFDKVVFLDTDTYQVTPFGIWDVLDHFDLAFCYDPIRWDYEAKHLPDAFPTPNTGMLAFRNVDSVKRLLEDWEMLYLQQKSLDSPPKHDQPAFREVVYRSNLRFLVLPDEFNLRVIFPHMVAGNTHLKMIHGRHEPLMQALHYAETNQFYPRVFGHNSFTGKELVRMLLQRILSRFRRGDVQCKRGVVRKA